MLFYTAGQGQIFLVMLYAGVLAGMIFDALDYLRRLFIAGPVLSGFIDLVFSALLFCVMLIAIMFTGGGELRWYAVMGALSGYLLYAFTLRRLLAFACGRLGRGVLWMFHKFKATKFFKTIFR